jgi:hypothetical protein
MTSSSGTAGMASLGLGTSIIASFIKTTTTTLNQLQKQQQQQQHS